MCPAAPPDPVQGWGIAGGLGSGGVGTGTPSPWGLLGTPSPGGLLGTPVANGSRVQCHFVCTRLPPGAGSPPDGGDRQPDGELPGVGRMWDPFCRFSVGNLPMWDRGEPGFLQIVVLACILTACLLWVLRLVRELRLMFLLLSCLARKIIGIGYLGLGFLLSLSN